MAWLKLTTSTSPFRYRFPVAVHNSSTTANLDVEVTIPPELDAFWQNIDVSGNEVRVTGADGVTELQYKWTSFTASSRTGVLEIYGASGTPTYSFTGSAVSLLWIYVDDGEAGDGSTTVTFSGTQKGYVTAAAPRGVILAGNPPPGRVRPPARRSQRTIDKRGYWFRLDDGVLRTARQAYNSHVQWEEVNYVEVTATTNGSGTLSPQLAATRFVYDRGFYIQVVVSGGTDANDYTLLAKVTTKAPNDDADAQIASGVALIQIRDADDA